MSKANTERIDAQKWYISNFSTFENSLNGAKDTHFHKIRQEAIAKFSEMGFPGKRDEEWKYTDVAPLLKHKFRMPDQPVRLSAAAVKKLAFQSLSEHLVVFVNGSHVPELSNYDVTARGVIIDSLENLLQERPDLLQQYLSQHAPLESESFVALNTAFAKDGLCVYIPDNVVVEEPIHLLFLSDPREGEFWANPRNLIVAGKNSQAKIVEKFAAVAEGVYFNNGVTEVITRENARIEHVRVQDENTTAYHIHSLQAHQERDSVYSLINVDMGGLLVRNNLNLLLGAPNCEGHLIGFYMGTGKQHIDNHTLIDHAKPNCFSNELYKGILGGKAKGVFNGKIYVRQEAQKTNSYQDNKALLLSDDARINTKPQLEIFADDVKCSHGATVGQLDEEALFYLRSRGIPQAEALSILQYAFASDVFGYISLEEVRAELDEILFERFKTL